jgi:hypothetical protein
MLTRICTKCGIEKPETTDYFCRHKCSKNGLLSYCKECQKIENKKYRAVNREERSHYSKEYWKKNRENLLDKKRLNYLTKKEEISIKHRQYRLENYQKIQEGKKMYQQKNRDHITKYRKFHYQQNKGKISNQNKQYYEINKVQVLEVMKGYRQTPHGREVLRLNRQRRAALDKELPSTLTLEEWEQCKKYFGNVCAYCGKDPRTLSQDHFIPVVNGGGYEACNIIPACTSCNSKKNTKNFFEWYPRQKFYSKEREILIMEYLDALKEVAITNALEMDGEPHDAPI